MTSQKEDVYSSCQAIHLVVSMILSLPKCVAFIPHPPNHLSLVPHLTLSHLPREAIISIIGLQSVIGPRMPALDWPSWK